MDPTGSVAQDFLIWLIIFKTVDLPHYSSYRLVVQMIAAN